MSQKSTDSINQFFYNKPTSNIFFHSIKYLKPLKEKKNNINKTFIERKSRINSKINLNQENQLTTSYSGYINNKYFTRKLDKKELSRSLDKFPRIIITKRGIKELVSDNYSLSSGRENLSKTLVNSTKRVRSDSYYISTEEKINNRNRNKIKSEIALDRDSNYSTLFYDNFYENNKTGKKEYAKYFRRNDKIKLKIDYSDYNRNRQRSLKDNNYNIRQYSQANLNKRFIMYNSSANLSNKKKISPEKNNLYNNYSVNNIKTKDMNKNKKYNHMYNSMSHKSFGKEEARKEYKRNYKIETKKNSNLYQDYSNFNKSGNANKSNYMNQNNSALNNKNHHILYESKIFKNENSIKRSKDSFMKVKIIQNDENKIFQNATKTKNHKKITKIENIKYINNNNNKSNIINISNKDKKAQSLNVITPYNNKTIQIKANKYEDKYNKQIKNNSDLDLYKKSINNSNNKNIIINNFISKSPVKENELLNKTDIYPIKKQVIKKEIKQLMNIEENDKNKTVKEDKNEQSENGSKTKDIDNSLRSSIDNKTENILFNNIRIKNKKTNKDKEREKNNKLPNNISYEISKVNEISFSLNENIHIAQNNTSNSNIIIIINNPEQKKPKRSTKSPKDNLKKKNIKSDDTVNNTNENKIINDKQTIKNNDKKDINVVDKKQNLKVIKNNKKINKPDTKIIRKPLKNVNITNNKKVDEKKIINETSKIIEEKNINVIQNNIAVLKENDKGIEKEKENKMVKNLDNANLKQENNNAEDKKGNKIIEG